MLYLLSPLTYFRTNETGCITAVSRDNHDVSLREAVIFYFYEDSLTSITTNDVNIVSGYQATFL